MKQIWVCVALSLLLAAPGMAEGVGLLDFGVIVPTAGSINYLTAGGTLQGDVQVDNVASLNTPVNTGQTLNCFQCRLRFQTGNFTGGAGNQYIGGWVFGTGGFVQLTGGIDFDNDGSLDIAANSVLLDGAFSEETVIINFGGSQYDFNMVGGSFLNLSNPQLVGYFGLPTNVAYNGFFNISFRTLSGITAPGTFSSTSVLSGDIVTQPTPEPSAILFLGTGLLLSAAFLRRRLSF